MAWCKAEIYIIDDSAIHRNPEQQICKGCLFTLTEDMIVDEPIDKALARGYEKVTIVGGSDTI